MTLEYTNRRGVRYFVLKTKTKTGKPKYYCGRNLVGEPVLELPPEFEIHEHPWTANVTIRKVKPSRLFDSEKEFLEEQIRKRSHVTGFIVEKDEDSLVVHSNAGTHDESPPSPQGEQSLTGLIQSVVQSRLNELQSHVYQPMFRFTLIDETNRLFSAERWCYRGAIDDWIRIGGPSLPLDELAEMYLPHLGEESFYELI